MINRLLELFYNVKSKLDPMIGCVVVGFRSTGCMGHIDEFEFIGNISGVEYKNEHKFYIIDIVKDEFGEKRDNNLKISHTKVLAKNLQFISKYTYANYN